MSKIPFKIQIVAVEVLDSSPRNASFNDAQVDDHCMHPRPVFMALSWFKTLKQVTSRRRIFPGRKKKISTKCSTYTCPQSFLVKSHAAMPSQWNIIHQKPSKCVKSDFYLQLQ